MNVNRSVHVNSKKAYICILLKMVLQSFKRLIFFSDAYISKIYHNLFLIFVLSFNVEMQLADLGNYFESSVTDKSSKITYKVLSCMPCNFS